MSILAGLMDLAMGIAGIAIFISFLFGLVKVHNDDKAGVRGVLTVLLILVVVFVVLAVGRNFVGQVIAGLPAGQSLRESGTTVDTLVQIISEGLKGDLNRMRGAATPVR